MSVNVIIITPWFMWNRTIYAIYSFFHSSLPFFILNNGPIAFQFTENSVLKVHVPNMIPWILWRSKTFTEAMSMLHKFWTFTRFISPGRRCISLLTLSSLHLNYLLLVFLSCFDLLFNGWLLIHVTIWFPVFVQRWMLVIEMIRCDNLLNFPKFSNISFFIDIHWFFLFFFFFSFWNLMTLMIFVKNKSFDIIIHKQITFATSSIRLMILFEMKRSFLSYSLWSFFYWVSRFSGWVFSCFFCFVVTFVTSFFFLLLFSFFCKIAVFFRIFRCWIFGCRFDFSFRWSVELDNILLSMLNKKIFFITTQNTTFDSHLMFPDLL